MLQPLSPLSRFATNIFTDKTQLLSLIVFFERTQTKTNNFTLSIYLRSQYTLFAKISLYFPSIHTSYNTVPNYHRRSLRNYRSDQIEQLLTLYRTSILLMAMTSMKKISRITSRLSSLLFFSLVFGRHVIPVALLLYSRFSTNTND